MGKRNTISLLIPAYNAAKFLPRLIGSAEKQAVRFDEIIVYDDCSTDNTALTAIELGCKVITGDRNRGCSYGRLMLAKESKCDFIHFHDADDDLLPNFTSLAARWLIKTNIPDVILFAFKTQDENTKEQISIGQFDKQELEKDAVRVSIMRLIPPFCGLYNRERFLEAGGPDLDPNILYNEDSAMHCKLAIFGLRFSSEEQISIVNYRVKNSMSRGSDSYKKVVNAQYHLMKKNRVNTNGLYNREIALKLWEITRYSAWVSDWKLLKNIIRELKNMNENVPAVGSPAFKIFCRLDPYVAVIVREFINRTTRIKGQYWY